MSMSRLDDPPRSRAVGPGPLESPRKFSLAEDKKVILLSLHFGPEGGRDSFLMDSCRGPLSPSLLSLSYLRYVILSYLSYLSSKRDKIDKIDIYRSLISPLESNLLLLDEQPAFGFISA